MQCDATGKVALDHIYTKSDPRDYFSTLRELDYRIPQLAKPYFAELIQEYRETQLVSVPCVLDIGCSYGINAALLKCDTTMDELYEHYSDAHALEQDYDTLLAHDQALVRSNQHRNNTRFVGLDNSRNALSYALSAGFIDAAVHADLEQDQPTRPQRELLAQTDLVISTGCLGYVGASTISHVANAPGNRKPWMAHFVLRMFPFEPVSDSLAELGYDTVSIDRVFKQRRFASSEEQSLILDALSTAGVDPKGMEADGWLYAQLYISRPRVRRRCDVIDLATSQSESSSSTHHRGRG